MRVQKIYKNIHKLTEKILMSAAILVSFLNFVFFSNWTSPSSIRIEKIYTKHNLFYFYIFQFFNTLIRGLINKKKAKLISLEE